jgi:DNA-binding NarL/FixJ family response regulator
MSHSPSSDSIHRTTNNFSSGLFPTNARDVRAGRNDQWAHEAGSLGSPACSPDGRIHTMRIVVADGCGVVRLGVKSMLEQHNGWAVIAEAENGEEAFEAIVAAKPDVAVLDFSLRLFNGPEVTRRVRQLSLPTEILILTTHDTEAAVRDTLHAGARGYMLKSDEREQLVAAVNAVSQHRPYFSWKVSEVLLSGFCQSSNGTTGAIGALLTPRERQILQLVSEGHSNKLMSRRLGISVKTVETHRHAVMRKIGAASLADLVRYAVRNNFVEA